MYNGGIARDYSGWRDMASNTEFSDFEAQLDAHVEVINLKLEDLKTSFRRALATKDVQQCKILDAERALLDMNRKRLLGMLMSVKQQKHEFLMSQLTTDFVKITQKSGRALGKSTPSEKQARAALDMFESTVSASNRLSERIGDLTVDSQENGEDIVESGPLASTPGDSAQDMLHRFAANFGLDESADVAAGGEREPGPVASASVEEHRGDSSSGGSALETLLGLPSVPSQHPSQSTSKSTGLDMLLN